MEDSNLIARLYPRGRLAAEFAKKRENAAFYFGHKGSGGEGTEDEEKEDVREAQGEAEDDKEGEEPKEGLQLRFDQRRKHKQGFLVGSSQDCDIILPSNPCLITFDEHGRLVVRDLGRGGCRGGTRVSYDGEGGHRRSGFTWILSGERFTERRVEVGFGGVVFVVVAAAHDMSCVEYLDKVIRFMSSGDDLSQGISLQGEHHQHYQEVTALISSNPILLDDAQIGDGGQAVVKRVWDVSTGRQYASKEPLVGLSGRARRQLRREAELMKKLQHANIVRFLCVVEDENNNKGDSREGCSSPRAILEYLPLGSLDQQARHHPLTSAESLEVLKQGLAALGFLHCRDPPIAHRDIKPGNMLVASRGPLRIKLSDFGLSKPRPPRDLVTYCGTQRYMAPEIHTRDKYDERVDVWSLGVVVLQYAHGLPSSRPVAGVVWGMRVVEYLDERGGSGVGCPLLKFLGGRMVRMEPGERGDAGECGLEAEGLVVSSCCASMQAVEDTSDEEEEDDDESAGQKQDTVARKSAARAASWAPCRKRVGAVHAERCRKRFKTSVRSMGVDAAG